MKKMLTILSLVTASSTVFAAGNEAAIVANLAANAPKMGVLASNQGRMYGTAERFVTLLLSEGKDLTATCARTNDSVETCVVTGKLSVHAPDGGPKATTTKKISFDIVSGVASGDIVWGTQE